LLRLDALIFPQDASQWLERLKQNGYRLTESRRAVVHLVAEREYLLNPLEIYEEARRTHPRLGLVSVYRTLDRLAQPGLSERVRQPDGCNAYIAARQGQLQLLICQNCRKVSYFSGDRLGALVETVEGESGFLVKDHWLQLIGLCSLCQQDLFPWTRIEGTRTFRQN
jgi:Fe2+ or Zn2+ uptake regulation protein